MAYDEGDTPPFMSVTNFRRLPRRERAVEQYRSTLYTIHLLRKLMEEAKDIKSEATETGEAVDRLFEVVTTKQDEMQATIDSQQKTIDDLESGALSAQEAAVALNEGQVKIQAFVDSLTGAAKPPEGGDETPVSARKKGKK